MSRRRGFFDKPGLRLLDKKCSTNTCPKKCDGSLYLEAIKGGKYIERVAFCSSCFDNLLPLVDIRVVGPLTPDQWRERVSGFIKAAQPEEVLNGKP